MKIVFTLCSINYLAQAATMCRSLRESNPDWQIVIGLVDHNNRGLDLSFVGAEILEVKDIPIRGFDDMARRYTIVELITAVKPSYFLHLFESRPADVVVYLDPDIMVLGSLAGLEQSLAQFDIVLTPHNTAPPGEDGLLPTEKHIFRTGVFNLGFLAVKRSENSMRMLHWWEDRLRYDCLVDLSRNLFVDQLWMNLAPAYFDKVLVERNPGYNAAHWNLQERVISKRGAVFFANEAPLVFFHFSHFTPGRPEEIAAYHTRYSFETRPGLRPLFDAYLEGLAVHRHAELKSIPCFYTQNERSKKRRRAVISFLRTILPHSFKIKAATLRDKFASLKKSA